MLQSCKELSGEAGAKFIDELRVESVGVTQRDYLAANAEIVIRSRSDEFLRERGTSPRHSVIAILGGTK